MKKNNNSIIKYELEIYKDNELSKSYLSENAITELISTNIDSPIPDVLLEYLYNANIGNTTELDIPIEEIYGEYDEELIIQHKLSLFKKESGLDDELCIGNIIPLTLEGEKFDAKILYVDNETNSITLDFNPHSIISYIKYKVKIIDIIHNPLLSEIIEYGIELNIK